MFKMNKRPTEHWSHRLVWRHHRFDEVGHVEPAAGSCQARPASAFIAGLDFVADGAAARAEKFLSLFGVAPFGFFSPVDISERFGQLNRPSAARLCGRRIGR